MYDDFSGADDALDVLGVSGTDYVGATNFRLPGGAALANKLRGAANAGMKLANTVSKTRKLRQQALAGYIPQIPLGVRSSSTVAAGGTATIAPEPSVPMRLTRFEVAPAISDYFLLTSMRVARLDMLAGSDAIPASAFLPNAQHPPLENPILPAGSQVSVGVENIDGAAHSFYATFWGVDLTPAAARIV